MNGEDVFLWKNLCFEFFFFLIRFLIIMFLFGYWDIVLILRILESLIIRE